MLTQAINHKDILTHLKATRVTEVGQERVECGWSIGGAVAPAAVGRAAAVERQVEAAERREGALAGAWRGLHRASRQFTHSLQEETDSSLH